MTNVVLVVIDEPERGTRTAFYWDGPSPKPMFFADGDVNLLCGDCGFCIAENMKGGQLLSVVLQCPRCLKFNETRS